MAVRLGCVRARKNTARISAGILSIDVSIGAVTDSFGVLGLHLFEMLALEIIFPLYVK